MPARFWPKGNWYALVGMALAASMAMLSIGTAQAEGVEVDCKETNLKFEAPTFKVTCKDYSESSISLSEISAASRTYTLFAMSNAELSFIHVLSNHVLGGTRIYLKLRSLVCRSKMDLDAKLSNWGDEEDVGDYEVKHVTASLRQRRSDGMPRLPQARGPEGRRRLRHDGRLVPPCRRKGQGDGDDEGFHRARTTDPG